MLKEKRVMTIRGLSRMFKYVYINKDNQILNINSFKKLNGGRALTKSQLKLLRLKIKTILVESPFPPTPWHA